MTSRARTRGPDRGRKRGEVVLTQGMLIHQGSGVWRDATIGAGNGDTRGQLSSAVEAVAEACGALGHPVDRALVIADGDLGGSRRSRSSRSLAWPS